MKKRNKNGRMKHLKNLFKSMLIAALCLTNAAFAQNAFDQRSNKSNNKNTPSFTYKNIRYSSTANQSIGGSLLKPVFDGFTPVEKPKEPSSKMLNGIYNSMGKIANHPHQIALNFIADHAEILNIKNPGNELINPATEIDNLGRHLITHQRVISNIPVFGGEVKTTVSSKNEVVVCGVFYSYPTTILPSKVQNTSAESIGIESVGKVFVLPAFDEQWQLSAGKGVSSKLVWASLDGSNLQQIYLVDYHPNHIDWWRILVDAQTGEVLRKYTKTCSIDGPKTTTAFDLNNQSRTLNTYQVGSNYFLIDATRSMFSSARSSMPNNPIGAIWTVNANNGSGSNTDQFTSGSNSWSDKSSVSAHFNAGVAFEYFKNTHNRNSINGNGGTIISVVNVTQDGAAMDNAYWNGYAMYYGNGKSAFKPLAGSLDVAGHEMSHGVIGSTANLEYFSQSGAINESFADVFGAMMDRDDWKLGEDVVKTSVFTSGALRDLSNPHNGGSNLNHNGYQPAKMSEYYTGSDDNQGVHINSGIVNHAYYLYASAITKDKAEKIYYRALLNYLTSSSDFLALRYAIVQAATDLHGTSSAEVSEAKKAFDAVEIYDPNAGSGGSGGGKDDQSPNTGAQAIISLDVDPANSNTVYKSSTAGTNFSNLSTTDLNRRVSVTDDGSTCIFVADDNNIHRITLKGTVAETSLTSDDFWDNCAISRDGNRLAGVSTEVDSAIYVYDFIKEEWKRFDLYNPTFSGGINAGGVLYADAIEFDYSGEYILYDARNLIKSSSGTDLDYWDIGTIRIWDNTSNAWGDGKVEKLFSQLPADVSIGNPTYSKNSPYIIAFDYIDEFDDEYAVLALNTEAGTVGTVFENNKLGYPSYSTDDDKIIFDGTSNGEDVIGIIGLATDKINGTGSASLLIEDAKWGVWYAEGTRKLLSDKKVLLSFSLPTLSGSPKGVFNGQNVTVTVPSSSNLTNLVPTFTHSSLSKVWVSTQSQTSGVTTNNFINPVLYNIQAEDGSSQSYTVTVVKESVGVNYLQNHTIRIYPNPSSSLIYMAGLTGTAEYELIGADGKVVKHGIVSEDDAVDVGTLKRGVYILILRNNEFGALHKSIIKN
jgi:Zn-dependent metalloprotease